MNFCSILLAQVVGWPRVHSTSLIATGTPAGIGAVRQPFPEGLLKTGDVVRVQIDGIGELCNTVVEEPEGYLAPETEVEAAWAR